MGRGGKKAIETNAADGDQHSDADANDRLYCYCQTKHDDRDMILCEAEGCGEWYHNDCINLSEEDAKACDVYICGKCEKLGKGRTRFKKAPQRARRERQEIDYSQLDNGDDTPLAHAVTEVLLERIKNFTDADFPSIKGEQMTSDFLRRQGWTQPYLVEAEHFDGLGMTLPPELQARGQWTTLVRAILEGVGAETPAVPFDVSTQAETEPFTLQSWAKYLLTPPALRKKILNLISLEISETKLGQAIDRPRVIRELDWIDYFWPPEVDVDDAQLGMAWPKVQLYCLMSPANSYTDWHLDFGGSSVFYHVLTGSKTFLFAQPTAANLKAYENWVSSPIQSSTFFADLVATKCKLTIGAGDTLFIPAGWIHAVLTNEDSIVVGGNMIHTLGIQTQIKVFEMEARTGVDPRFRFPWWERLHWYAASWYAEQSRSDTYMSGLTNSELQNLSTLAQFLGRRLAQLPRDNDHKSTKGRKTKDDVSIENSSAMENGGVSPQEAARTKRRKKTSDGAMKYSSITPAQEAELVRAAIPPDFGQKSAEIMVAAKEITETLYARTYVTQMRRDPVT